ncbi:hypothetical protein BDI4_1080076 [Burkholderia diffusa]|nr:hypothetical protein BDI4_1080076 [Burkholderia diffusa]
MPVREDLAAATVSHPQNIDHLPRMSYPNPTFLALQLKRGKNGSSGSGQWQAASSDSSSAR